MTRLQIITKKFPCISYTKCGTGPALMLLHGFPLDGSIWDAIVPDLAQQFTVLVPDLPGVGQSILSKEGASIDDLAELVPAILKQEGLEACVLAGHSMGGYIALAAAELFPNLVQGLALIHSTANADSEEKREKRQRAIDLIENGGQAAFVRVALEDLLPSEFKLTNPDLIQAQIDRSLKVPDFTLVNAYRAMMARPDRKEVLARCVMPVLFVFGKEDTVIPYKACLQQSLLPNVSFVELYAACGHMSMMEYPERLQRDLRTFVGYCAGA